MKMSSVDVGIALSGRMSSGTLHEQEKHCVTVIFWMGLHYSRNDTSLSPLPCLTEKRLAGTCSAVRLHSVLEYTSPDFDGGCIEADASRLSLDTDSMQYRCTRRPGGCNPVLAVFTLAS